MGRLESAILDLWLLLDCGAELRFEKDLADGDDTAANGIRMIFC